MRRLFAGAAAFAVACTLSASATAAPPWVDRTLTLPRHDWAFDFGLGLAHHHDEPHDLNGPGLNAEMAVSPTNRLELGLRAGVRMGDDARATQADYYGRLFDRQTFGTGTDTFANPEFRVTGEVVQGDVVELGLQGRVVLPIEANTYATMMFGLPIWFHIGHRVRLDTGLYVPVTFAPTTETAFSAPIDVWIQASPRVWLGPMSGFVYHNRENRWDVPIGFGFGYQFTHALDLKAMLLFPAVNHDDGARDFGAGVGVQIRIE